MKFNKLVLLLIFFLTKMQEAPGNVPEMYGMGARASALAGAYSSISNDPNAQFYNPASIPFNAIGFSYTVINTKDSFKPPGLIKISDDNTKLIDDIDYKNSFGNAISFHFPIYSVFSFGFTGYMPYGNILNFIGEDPFAPQYIMYISRSDRPIFNPNISIKLLKGVSLGVGSFISQNISGDIGLFIDENETQTPSYATLNMSIKPIAYFSFGTLVRVFDIVGTKDYFFDVGFSFKQEAKYKAKFNADASLDIQFSNIYLNAILFIVPYFDPQTLSLGINFGKKNYYLVTLDVVHEKWSSYSPPFIKLDGNFSNVFPVVNFKDRILYKLGGEYSLMIQKKTIFIRGGFAYVPTPVPDQKNDGNILDCDKKIYSLGLGFVFSPNTKYLKNDLNIDFHYQYHVLNDRLIKKETSSTIGYSEDGYVVGGKITALGMSFSLNF